MSCFSLLVVHHKNHHGVVSFATIWIFLASVGDKSQQREMYSEKKYNGQKKIFTFEFYFLDRIRQNVIIEDTKYRDALRMLMVFVSIRGRAHIT